MTYDHSLSDQEKRELLRIARATLKEFLRTGRTPPGKPHRDCLVAPAATFVTLHVEDTLRGCIGAQDESKPLYKSIQDNAVAAATRDSRFEALRAEEVNGLIIEISVLGDRNPMAAPEQIEVGTHGLAVESQGQRGLLLPQVASEHNWDVHTFLEQVCAKAGLPAEAWKEAGTTIHTFTAQVFSDTSHPPQKPVFR